MASPPSTPRSPLLGRSVLSILGDLPTELAYAILLEAARIGVLEDRPWVTQLALVSRAVYRLIHPVMYHTLAPWRGDYGGGGPLDVLLDDPTCAHVLAAARRLWYPWPLPNRPEGNRSGRLAGVVEVAADLYLLKYMAAHRSFAPREIAIRFVTHLDHFSRATLSNVTHLTTKDPVIFRTAEWTERFLLCLPNLTHLALEQYTYANWTQSSNLDNFRPALQAILVRDAIHQVLFIGLGEATSLWAAVLALCRDVRDPRVHVWLDTRHTRTQGVPGLKMRRADFQAGRRVWDQGHVFNDHVDPS